MLLMARQDYAQIDREEDFELGNRRWYVIIKGRRKVGVFATW